MYISAGERNDTIIFISYENDICVTIGYVYIQNMNIGGTQFKIWHKQSSSRLYGKFPQWSLFSYMFWLLHYSDLHLLSV